MMWMWLNQGCCPYRCIANNSRHRIIVLLLFLLLLVLVLVLVLVL